MKLVFYMKSGNRFVVSNVKSYKIKNSKDGIEDMSLEHYGLPFTKAIVGNSVDCSQIEAIIEVK